jgi:hypothetical protein
MRKTERTQHAAYGQVALKLIAEWLAYRGSEAVRFERYRTRQGFYPDIPKDEPDA